MGCGSSNSTVPVVSPKSPEPKQAAQNSKSKASPKPTLMKADKFLSREEARERRQKALEEKQSRSQNNARAISAQALVDQERLSTSTRRSVRSFASSSTATPLRATEPTTQELSLQKETDDPEIVQISAVVESGHKAPEVIVEESKSIISSEDKEGKLVSFAKDGGPEQSSGRAGKGEEEGAIESGSICQDDMNSDLKSEEITEAGESELSFGNSQNDEGRETEGRTMENENMKDNNDSSEQCNKQSSSENNEFHAEEVVSVVEDSPEVAKNLTESDEESRGQRSNRFYLEPSEDGDVSFRQDVDGGSIMDHEMGVEGKVQQREGIQGEASDGSDEGVADLDDVDDEGESEVQGGTS